MAFTFGFSGEDIDNDSDEEMRDVPPAPPPDVSKMPIGSDNEDQRRNTKKARREDMMELLSSLPSRISYTTSLIVSPHKHYKALIPRRALFDVKIQIMAESDDDDDNDVNLTSKLSKTNEQQINVTVGNDDSNTGKHFKTHDVGLGNSDIEKNVYEGGFKSWEGAMDLAQLILDTRAEDGVNTFPESDCIVELGCGTAMPSLILFRHALSNDIALNLTLADYNDSVLRLVTIPNLLLTWALQHSRESFSPQPPSISTSATKSIIYDAEGDLEIHPTLIEAFTSDLVRRKIDITLISGPWSASQDFTSLIPISPKMPLLILAAETIYSPATLRSFKSALLAILRLVEQGKALIAAKRMYFGVGGGVDEFKELVVEAGGVVVELEGTGIAGCDRSLMKEVGGVGRWLGEVKVR